MTFGELGSLEDIIRNLVLSLSFLKISKQSGLLKDLKLLKI